MSQFQKELEWAHFYGLISGSERGAALDLVMARPEKLPRQLAFIQGINRLSLRLI